MRYLPLIAALAALLIPGCVTMDAPPAVAATGDYGRRPLPAEAKQLVSAFIKGTFKDPYSVQDLQIGEPQKFSSYRGLLNGGGYMFGYTITFSCNAKNSYGAYTGSQTTQIVVKNGRIAGFKRPGDVLWNPYVG